MCRMLLIGVITLAFTDPGFSQDRKANTLTPKEIAEGWILLFDGETTFGWKSRDTLRAEDGQLILGGKTTEMAVTTTHLGDGIFVFQRKRTSMSEKDHALFHLRNRPIVLDILTPEWVEESYEIKNDLGTRMYIHKTNGVRQGGNRALLEFHYSGSIGFETRPGTVAAFRNVRFLPKPTVPLFTGKDLAGWKTFPGKKSEFAVIDGAINIKDGPGDLQTEKQFGDFCLQLDCISHGEHLNSGVFFRCRPNEYQNGYEAQVRNQFTEKATQKYLLEEYDPETNKLLGKKEAMFTAVDFGTGAIYRRQPARKAMSQDKEWFMMTVVAHGNHFATWVNGVQVTDWYDHRAKSDNARTGCRLEAGHISLQGHDPTTNLSFKNFRIQEYPAK